MDIQDENFTDTKQPLTFPAIGGRVGYINEQPPIVMSGGCDFTSGLRCSRVFREELQSFP
ncbi:hypothetical protein BH11PAT2_BH11PAT2_02570 [soil metagenome]